MKRDLGTWTHHASAKDTLILDQVASNPAESTMHMVGARVRLVPTDARSSMVGLLQYLFTAVLIVKGS